MKYIKVTITLPEDVAEKLNKVNNKSGELADALRFYSEWKDKAKAMMTNSDQILRLLTRQGTGDFQGQTQGPIEVGSLAWWRREYPHDIFKETDGEVMIQHKGTKLWARADEVY